MSKVGRWSTTAGNNNAAPPDGWPEGQAPSTINDCARENMAAIRTAFADLQFVDQDFTPSYITATSFSIPGNQTSAIHAGRRLKLYDANTLYATISTASFSIVTTIHLEMDAGTITNSLSAFGVAILSVNSNGLPRHANFTVSILTVAAGVGIAGGLLAGGGLTVSGTAAMMGPVRCDSTLSVSGTVVAANVAKAFVRTSWVTAASVTVVSSFNIASVSRSASGCVRINFTNALPNANYMPVIAIEDASNYHAYFYSLSTTTTYCKFTAFSNIIGVGDFAAHDNFRIFAVFY